jgi:hypothetical protein
MFLHPINYSLVISSPTLDSFKKKHNERIYAKNKIKISINASIFKSYFPKNNIDYQKNDF